MMEYRGDRVASPAPVCLPPPLSPSSKITTRSATAPSASASPPSPNPRRCAPSRRCTCFCRRYRCYSWAKNGPPRRLSRSSAISSVSSPMRCERDGARSSPSSRSSRTRRSGSASPTRRPRPPSLRPSSTGTGRPGSPMPAGSNGIAACLRVRHAEIVPRLAGVGGNAARFELIGEVAVLVRWRLNGGEELVLAANLTATPRDGFPAAPGRILWQEGAAKGGSSVPGPCAGRLTADDDGAAEDPRSQRRTPIAERQ